MQREDTVVGDRLETKVGNEKRVNRPVRDAPKSVDPDSATDDSDAKSSHRKRTVVTKKRESSSDQADPDSATVVSGDRDRQTDDPQDSATSLSEQTESEARTHFQTVAEGERRPGFFHTGISDDESTWANRLAIAGMVIALLIGVGLIVYGMRAPSVDELYAKVIEAEDTSAMKAFIKRFPEDPRFNEVLNLHMNARLNGQVKRLQAQRKLGVTPLDAYEESFLVAIEDRFQHPTESIGRLDQWLVVYDSPESELDESLTTLIELARHEREQLRGREPKIMIDPRNRIDRPDPGFGK